MEQSRTVQQEQNRIASLVGQNRIVPLVGQSRIVQREQNRIVPLVEQSRIVPSKASRTEELHMLVLLKEPSRCFQLEHCKMIPKDRNRTVPRREHLEQNRIA